MHGSRRAATLQPGDYDHEITLTDDEAAQSLRPTSSVSVGGVLAPTNTSTRLLSDGEPETEQNQGQPPDDGETERRDDAHLHPSASRRKDGGTTCQATTLETTSELGPSQSGVTPSIEIRGRLGLFRDTER